MSAAILATGSYVPDRVVDNAALAMAIPGHDEFFARSEQISGIVRRHRASSDQATSDLVVGAARIALERAGIEASDLDLVVVGTDSPDYLTPCTSVVVQAKLGATRAGTFDVGCGCASFPTALSAVSGMIATNAGIRYALVAGAYLMSRLAAPDDPMQFFYGDGAGAVVVARSRENGLLGTALRADGSYASAWGIFAGGTAAPATVDRVNRGDTMVRVIRKYPREVNEEGWPILAHELGRRCGFAVRDVDCWIFTQVRRETIENVVDRLEVPRERAHLVMHEWGYTGSACVPMALDHAIRHGAAKRGDLVVLIGSGVGFNQAGVALRLTGELV